MSKFAGKWKCLTPPRDEASPLLESKPFERKSPRPASLNPAQTGRSASKPVSLHYTGTKLLGIAAMHKSNLVPVFSQEEAEDVATMRRGK